MAKKRSCRRTELERSQHETAVKVRKMTDEQICDFIDGLESVQPDGNLVGEFLDRLTEKTGFGGVSARTITKLKNIAAEFGYISEVG